jgi:hypothetical protein
MGELFATGISKQSFFSRHAVGIDLIIAVLLGFLQ